MKKKCIQCSQEFEKKINCSLKDWEKSKFCSMKCKVESQKGKSFFRPTVSQFKGKHHTDKNKEIMRQAKLENPTRFWLGKKRSQETINKIKETKRLNPLLREKGPNWKGGISAIAECIRGGHKNRKWIIDVFKKNNYICQKCNQRGGLLIVHHVKSFSTILHRYNIKTLEEADNCFELWDINNGITFCNNCHEEFHRRFKRGKNTLEQLLNFINN